MLLLKVLIATADAVVVSIQIGVEEEGDAEDTTTSSYSIYAEAGVVINLLTSLALVMVYAGGLISSHTPKLSFQT